MGVDCGLPKAPLQTCKARWQFYARRVCEAARARPSGSELRALGLQVVWNFCSELPGS